MLCGTCTNLQKNAVALDADVMPDAQARIEEARTHIQNLWRQIVWVCLVHSHDEAPVYLALGKQRIASYRTNSASQIELH
jgi:hypothetical protein